MFGFGKKKVEPSENAVDIRLLQAEIIKIQARLDVSEQKFNNLKGWCYKQKQIFENPTEKEEELKTQGGIVGFPIPK